LPTGLGTTDIREVNAHAFTASAPPHVESRASPTAIVARSGVAVIVAPFASSFAAVAFAHFPRAVYHFDIFPAHLNHAPIERASSPEVTSPRISFLFFSSVDSFCATLSAIVSLLSASLSAAPVSVRTLENADVITGAVILSAPPAVSTTAFPRLFAMTKLRFAELIFPSLKLLLA